MRISLRIHLMIAIYVIVGGLAHPFDSPLEPVDTTSPRATYRSFIRTITEIRDALERDLPPEAFREPVERLLRCFDLEAIPQAERRDTGAVTALQLSEILGRIDPIDVSSLPDARTAAEEDIRRVFLPGTEIAIERIDEGIRTGEYLISADSIKRMEEFYRKVEDLPYRSDPDVWEGALITYLNVPGKYVPLFWADDLPVWLTFPVLEHPAWKILLLVISVVLLVAIVYGSFRLASRLGGTQEKSPLRRKLVNLGLAIFLMYLFYLFRLYIDDVIGLRRRLQDVASNTAYILTNVSFIALVFIAIGLIHYAVISSRYLRDRGGVNEHLLRVISQLVALIVASFVAIRAVEYLGLQIVPVLAGLGIGGIAIALAARPTLENVIGGLILFADKPVKVGDLCRYGDELGIIEEIGLRSTRIRKLDDTLVSVPNSKFSQMNLENRTRRRKILYETTLQFRYETTDDQLRFLLVRIREMLLGHPKVAQERLRVRFLGFGAYSLDIHLFAYVKAKDWEHFLGVREDINFRIMKIVKECGASFAFPSTTAYIAQDGEVDEKAVRDSEKRVERWRKNEEFPFPEHTAEARRELKNTLDYPPVGSPENKE